LRVCERLLPLPTGIGSRANASQAYAVVEFRGEDQRCIENHWLLLNIDGRVAEVDIVVRSGKYNTIAKPQTVTEVSSNEI